MGYHLNRLDEPVFMAVSKPLLTEFGIHHILESCGGKDRKIQVPTPGFSSRVKMAISKTDLRAL